VAHGFAATFSKRTGKGVSIAMKRPPSSVAEQTVEGYTNLELLIGKGLYTGLSLQETNAIHFEVQTVVDGFFYCT
jgi:hypothetical protein